MEMTKTARHSILPNTSSLKCSLCDFMSDDVHLYQYKALLLYCRWANQEKIFRATGGLTFSPSEHLDSFGALIAIALSLRISARTQAINGQTLQELVGY
jgi:hypothetical protein